MGKKRINIGIDEDIHTQAKIIATVKKIPLGEFFEKAVKDAVKKDKSIIEKLLKVMIIPFFISLLVVSADATSLDLVTKNLIYQGDPEAAAMVVTSNNPFPGFISLTYDNLIVGENLITFTNNSFFGSGPYYYEYHVPIKGIRPGQFILTATLLYANGTMIDSKYKNGAVNSSMPKILSKKPIDIVTTPSTKLEVSTDEDSICRYSTENSSFVNMQSTFTVTGGKTHSQVINGLTQQRYTYYVACTDDNGYYMNNSEKISFVVDFPPTAEISISDHSPVKEGTVKVEVLTSENLDIPPKLEYSFNDNPNLKKIISLAGSGSLWEGYMIITSDNNNKVGTFYFEGTDTRGSTGNLITDGSIFLVDTQKPPAPINIKPTVTKAGNIAIEWYYEGEEIDGFNIYRSTSSGTNYIDFYTEAANSTSYLDVAVEDKVTYYYRIAAVDKAGNVGVLSEEVHATALKGSKTNIEENNSDEEEQAPPKVLPPELVVKVNDFIKRIDTLDIDLDSAKNSLSDTTGEVKDIVDSLSLLKTIDESKAAVSKLKNDFEAMKQNYKTDAELDSEIAKGEAHLASIQKSVVKEVSVVESSDTIQRATKKDTELAADLVFHEMDPKLKNAYLNKLKEIQDASSIEASIRVVKIRYLDESTLERTIVKKKVSYLNADPIQDVIVVENIPKSFASDAKDITFITPDYEVVQSDPIVKWGFLEMGFQAKEISYSVDRRVSLNDAKDALSIILVGPTGLMVQGKNDVVGYSILSSLDFGLTGWNRTLLFIGVGLIFILALYYIVFIKFSPKQLISRLKPRNNKKQPRLFEHYPELNQVKETNKGVPIGGHHSKKLKNNANYELAQRLLDESQNHLVNEDFDKAAELYPQIQMLYSALPKEYQSTIYIQCIDIQKSIKQYREQYEQEILRDR